MFMGRLRGRAHRSSGFTLIELVFVMTIIVILAGAISLQLTNQSRNAKRARALQDIKTLETAIDLYAADNGTPPSEQQGLQALKTKPNSPPVPMNWNGPYVKEIKRDPWGSEYIYQYPGQLNPDGYDLISYGEDGRPGGDNEYTADVTNSEESQ